MGKMTRNLLRWSCIGHILACCMALIQINGTAADAPSPAAADNLPSVTVIYPHNRMGGEVIVESPAFLPQMAPSVSSAGYIFGPLVALAGSAGTRGYETPARSKKLADRIRQYGFDAPAELAAVVAKKLEGLGLRTRVLNMPHNPRGQFIDNLPAIADGADAYLDAIGFSAGYVAATAESPFVPYVRVFVRLVPKGTNDTAYEKIFSSSPRDTARPANPSSSVYELIHVPSREQYHFAVYEDLIKEDKRAVDGIRDTFAKVAEAMAEDIKANGGEILPALKERPR